MGYIGNREESAIAWHLRVSDDAWDNRVIDQHCNLRLNNDNDDAASSIGLTYGEPFQFTFYTYHGDVKLWCNRYIGSALYRIGD